MRNIRVMQLRNLFDSLKRGNWSKVYYIIEDANWSIKWDGLYITENLKTFVDAEMSICFRGLRKQILHFGSRNTYLPWDYPNVHSSNKIILTWFHGTDDETHMIEALQKSINAVTCVHTSCELTKNKLIRWGVPENKLVKIPLGVDLNKFRPFNPLEKLSLRKKLGIPNDVICVGSFQKDGVGWGKGLEPKLIKGPDIFIKVIGELVKRYPIFVLLTGPARGYVKKELEALNVNYKHIFLENYQDIGDYYSILDLYMVTSREEGGPKAVLESIASGVPLVSTRVGMAPEVIQNGVNGFLTEIEDVNRLIESASKLIENEALRSKFINKGLQTVKAYDWSNIASMYYEHLYKPLRDGEKN